MAAIAAPTASRGAEGGLTNYLAGYFGDFAVAVTPQPGLVTYSTAYYYRAKTEGPKIPDTISLDGIIQINGFQFVTRHKLFGAQLAFGGYTTLLQADLSAAVPTGAGTTFIEADANGFGDSSISPLILYWSHGNLYVNLYENIIIPTGRYSTSRILNTGRNYFSFDTVLALTWLDLKRGLELSLVPGVMINTKNSRTDYKTGAEFHLDGMANLFLSPEFAIGLHTYAYAQIEDDTGAGAIASGLRSSSAGIGPSVLWLPKRLGIDGKIVGKWLHEYHARNRFKGDIVSLTIALRF